MRTVLLPPCVNSISVNKYIYLYLEKKTYFTCIKNKTLNFVWRSIKKISIPVYGFFKFILVFQQVRDIRNYELFQLKTNII